MVAGDPVMGISIAKISAKGFPFGRQGQAVGCFAFPKELIAGPVDLKRKPAGAGMAFR